LAVSHFAHFHIILSQPAGQFVAEYVHFVSVNVGDSIRTGEKSAFVWLGQLHAAFLAANATLMRTSMRQRVTLAAVVLSIAMAATAHGQWTITTYTNPGVEITSMSIADQVFSGARPQRFDATTTVAQVDLFENGGNGQFLINNAFPGMDQNENPGDTRDFTARVTGTLVVNTAGPYDFFTDSDDGNRFRLDLNQNGTFEDGTESILPDGGLQGTGTPERSGIINLAAGNYNYEISFFERGGGGSIDAGYRVNGVDPQFVIGDATGGIGTTGQATVRAVGAVVSPFVTNFAIADALRNGVNGPGFPVSAQLETFNLEDTGGFGVFPNTDGAPGLGAPGANDDDDFLVVGTGTLVVPAGGVTGAIFRSNTDDGGRLLIDTNQDGDLSDAGDVVILQDVLQGPTNTDSTPINLAAGNYLIEYSWFERNVGGEGEVSVSLNGGGPNGLYTLLGDNEAVRLGTGLEVIPEPSTVVLAGLAVLGLVALARRKR
jgi:hypothetical protein